MNQRKEQGFTLLEIMIAVAIFGFMLIGISQIIRVEMQNYHLNSQREELQQGSRRAMITILDQLRLKAFKYYSYHDGVETDQNPGPDRGVYYYNINPTDPANPGDGSSKCIIDVKPSFDADHKPIKQPIVYFDDTNNTINYEDEVTNDVHVIANNITSLSITEDPSSGPIDYHFVTIEIKAEDKSGNTFDLVTYARLY